MCSYRIVLIAIVFQSLFILGLPDLSAQSKPAPQVYSVTETNSMMVSGMSTKFYRDSSKALVDQSYGPRPENPKGFHLRTLYDLAGLKFWTWDLIETDRPCSAGTFGGDWGDPFEFSAKQTADKDKQKPPQVGKEMLNGMATKVFEMADPNGQAKSKVWLDEQYGLIVKWEMTPAGGPAQTLLEVKQLSLAKPTASTFTKPAACAKAEAEAAAAQAPEIKTAHQVTAVHLDDPPKYTGACPAIMHFTGTITTDGPGTVWFKISAGVTGKEGEGEVKFNAAGTKKVSKDLIVSSEPGGGGGSALLEAAMEDDEGRHKQFGTTANNRFEFDCGGGK